MSDFNPKPGTCCLCGSSDLDKSHCYSSATGSHCIHWESVSVDFKTTSTTQKQGDLGDAEVVIASLKLRLANERKHRMIAVAQLESARKVCDELSSLLTMWIKNHHDQASSLTPTDASSKNHKIIEDLMRVWNACHDSPEISLLQGDLSFHIFNTSVASFLTGFGMKWNVQHGFVFPWTNLETGPFPMTSHLSER